ncbi:hypothetical protein T459_14944 [Capsicum annuum]|uniref:Uncharacterized protein n=1 Tax=Capsicum annuum TaxID=4072 RepID=A0A2G2ZIV1_CAPAN|nr:hypothetical protein T459_14944 [Capsicum annuum]
MPLSLSCTGVQCKRATGEQHEPKKVDVTVEATTEKHNITVDNPSTASKEEEKREPVNSRERRIRVYDSISQRRCFRLSSEIQKLAKILPTYLDMSSFLDQKVRTDWSMIEVYRDKMGNPFDVQYVEGIAQQTIGSLEAKAQKLYASDIKDPRRPKSNFVAPDEEQLVHIELIFIA